MGHLVGTIFSCGLMHISTLIVFAASGQVCETDSKNIYILYIVFMFFALKEEVIQCGSLMCFSLVFGQQ